jgi:rhodanese-related sulfurtransferase
MVATISRDELKRKIDRRDKFTLVETLAPDAFRQGHLPGAVNLPPDKVKELAAKVLPDKDADIVVYCGNYL